MSATLRPPSSSPSLPHSHSSSSRAAGSVSPAPLPASASAGGPPPSPAPAPSPSPPPVSATPPPQTNTCTHYQSISIPSLHSRFRVASFLSSFPSSPSLPCSDCRKLHSKKDLWVCLSCQSGQELRCGRGADGACAIEHAKETRHGLVMNVLSRMIWCYFCDTEVLDEYGGQRSSSVLPQRIRHCIDPADPTTDPEEEHHTKPRTRRSSSLRTADVVSASSATSGSASAAADDAESDSDDDDENWTWIDYYNNAKGGEVGMSNLGNTCLPERDMRVLTDAGFLFVSEVEALEADRKRTGGRVLFACYEAATQSIVYAPGSLVFAPPPARWVDFTEADTRRHWSAGSDDYGATDAEYGNFITARTTPDHEMFVQLGAQDADEGDDSSQLRMADGAVIPPHKMPAAHLAPGFTCSCDPDDSHCAHGYPIYRMFTAAASGIAHADFLSILDRSADSPVVALGLRSSDQLNAFLELYGFWLGSGDLWYSGASHGGVGFSLYRQRDRVYLFDLLARLPLRHGADWGSRHCDRCLVVRITADHWFRYFDSEYGISCRQSRPHDCEAAIAVLTQPPTPTARPDAVAGSTAPTPFSADPSSSIASRTREEREETGSLSSSDSDSFASDWSESEMDGDRDGEREDCSDGDEASTTRRVEDSDLLQSSSPSSAVDDAEQSRSSHRRLWSWALTRLNRPQLRLLLGGLQRSAASASSQPAATARKDVRGQHTIRTSSVLFRDQLVHACLHAGYSAYFVINRRAGERRDYQAAPGNCCGNREAEKEELQQFQPQRVCDPVISHDEWAVCYSEATSELLPARDVRFNGAALRQRQLQRCKQGAFPVDETGREQRAASDELRGGRAQPAASSSSSPTEPADAYDATRDGRAWCVHVRHPDHLIFVQRAHIDASGFVTKAGRPLITGNCFMSSALQALSHTPPLVAFLSEMSHIPLDSIRQRLIADFSVLLQKVWSGHYSLVAPGDLLRDIIFINPFFRGYGQHDSQELIRCIIDQMHEGLKRCEEYDYLHYVYGEGTGEEQEQRWREKEQQQRERERDRLLHDKNREKRQQKKGDKEWRDRKRRERERDRDGQQQQHAANGHSVRHAAADSHSLAAPTPPLAASSSEQKEPSSSSSATPPSSSSSAPSASPSPSPTPSSASSSDPLKKPVKVWPEHSVISDIFSGFLESRIRCHQCSSISTVFDQFYDLSLEIPKDSNLKRIAAERGSEAMTPAGKQSWLGSLLTYTGIMPAPLSLETCLTGDHRVLTRSGWRSITAVQVGDAVLSFSIDSYAMEWKPVLAVQSHAVNRRKKADKLYRMQGSGMDVIATSDHRMLLARMDRRGEFGLRPQTAVGYETVAELLPPARSYHIPALSPVTAFAHSPSRSVICAGINRQPAVKIVIPGLKRLCDWWWRKDEQRGFLTFLGFWLGDGHLDAHHGTVCIGQTKAAAIEWLDALLPAVFPRCWTRLPPNATQGEVRYTVRCPPLYEYLRVMAVGPLGYNPRDPVQLRVYPHFTVDSGLAAVEQQSDVYQANNSGGYYSTWTEEEMLGAMMSRCHRLRGGKEKEEEKEEVVVEMDDAPAVQEVVDEEGDSVEVPVAEAIVGDAVAAAAQAGGEIVWWNAGLWIIIRGHWFYLKRWLGDPQQIADVYSRLSRQQAVALLDGFCRAGGEWKSVRYADDDGDDAPHEPTGAWKCSNSSFPLIDHLQLIAQLAGARTALKLHTKAGTTNSIDGRTVTFSVDHWMLTFHFTTSCSDQQPPPPFPTAPLAQPEDVSADISARGYYEYNDIEHKVYCITVGSNSNFLTQRLSRTRSSSGHIHVTAHSVFVGNCLHAFCTSDRLIDRDQYRCDRCKVKVDASKTLSLQSLPEVLMLHIKRFAHNSYFGSKVNRHVNFPVQGLDMKAFLSEERREKMQQQQQQRGGAEEAEDSSSVYDLYAVIRHLGSVAGGHYICYAQNHITRRWYEFDDRQVTEINERRLQDVEAYVLFYRRRHSAQLKQALLDRIQEATLTSIPQPPASPPCRFLSRQFIKRVNVMGKVEPIDNRDLLCVHGVPYELPSDGGQLALPVSKDGWERLIRLYGGGPMVDGARHDCAECMIPLIRQRERKRISALDNEASVRSLPTDPFYLIHDDWLRRWRAFIGGSNVRPGPITNTALLNPDGTPREGLLKVRDYRGLHGTVWDELLRCYGGGPEIVRRRLDIYDDGQDRRDDREDDTAQQAEQQQDGSDDKAAQRDDDGAEEQAEQEERKDDDAEPELQQDADVGEDEEKMNMDQQEDDGREMDGDMEEMSLVSFHAESSPRMSVAEDRGGGDGGGGGGGEEDDSLSSSAMRDDKMEENKSGSPSTSPQHGISQQQPHVALSQQPVSSSVS